MKANIEPFIIYQHTKSFERIVGYRAKIRHMKTQIELGIGSVGNYPTVALMIISDISFVSFNALLYWYKSGDSKDFDKFQMWKDDTLDKFETAMCEVYPYNDKELKMGESMKEYLPNVFYIPKHSEV